MLILKITLVFCFLLISTSGSSKDNFGFSYNGFRSSSLSLDGIAKFTASGLLKLTNSTTFRIGHAFYPNPIEFKNSFNGSAFSFSTSFVFAIVSEDPTFVGHGMAFVISPTRGLPGASSSQHLGLFNGTTIGNRSNHVAAVELDTFRNEEFGDINDNHVGVDINDLRSGIAEPAGYYPDQDAQFRNLTLNSGKPMRVWVEYSGLAEEIEVTLAPINVSKPVQPLLSVSCDLSPILNQTMYIGFSSSTGMLVASHYVLGWSFKMNGVAPELDISQLPKLPRVGPKEKSKFLIIGLPVIVTVALLITLSGVIYHVRRKEVCGKGLKIGNWIMC